MPYKTLTLALGLAGALFAQAPNIVGTNPDTALVGTSFPILLYGMNFQPGAKIFWNNVVIGNQVNGPLSMVGIVPPQLTASAGTAQITVKNPDGTTSNAVTFNIRTTSVTPNFVGASPFPGDSNNNSGLPPRQLFFVGTGMQPGIVLNWGGQIFQAQAAYPFLSFNIPVNLMLTPGPVNLTVTNPGGPPSNVRTLVIPLPRTLTSVSPATISPGAGSATLTVNGSGFSSGDALFFLDPTGNGNAIVLIPQFVSSSQLQVTVPSSMISSPTTYGIAVGYTGPAAGEGVPVLSVAHPKSPLYFSANFLTFTVGPPGCTYSLSAATATVGAAASNGSVRVLTQPGCAWTASSPSNAVSITAPAGGNGSGTGFVSYAVQASNTPQSVTLTIAGLSYTINQVAGCLFGLSPSSATASVIGTSGGFNLGVTQPSCAWTAVSNVPWLQVVSGGGSGNGVVNYSVASNNSNTGRTGTITAGGETFTVVQAGNAPCTYSLSQASQAFAAAGGPGTATVQTPAGCLFTAGSNVQWLTITNVAGGTVSYSVSPNSATGSRTGSMTIAGLTYTVTQAGTSSSLTCSANAPAPPSVALEGRSELLGDLQLSCTGLAGPVTADISLTLNTDVTNRLTAGNTTDATLLVNEANPQNGQIEAYNTLRWQGVSLAADSSGTATIRITNVRADASLLIAPANLQSAPVTGLIDVESQTPVPVANVLQIMAFAAPTLAFQKGSPQPPTGGFLTNLTLTYGEATPTAFQAGTTRLRLVISNIPSSVTVFAPVFPNEGTTQAQLYSADANGAGGSPVPGSPFNGGTYQQLTPSNGTATATWLVTTANPNQMETRTFLLLLGNATASDLSQIQVSGSLGPVSTVGVASTTAPIPRYRDFSVPQKLVNLRVSTTVGTSPIQPHLKPLANPVGSNLTFTTTLVNDDAVQTATNVTVRDNVSSGSTIVSCSSSDGQSCGSGNQSSVSYPALSPGQTQTVTVTVAPGGSLADGSVVDNDVGVTSDDPNATLAGTSAATSSIVLNGVPVAVGNQPASGAGASQTFTFQFSHPDGYLNLGVVNVLINNVIDARHACYLAYSLTFGTLYLIDDGGDAGGPYAGTIPMGGSGTIQNSQCTVGLVSAAGSGTTLTLMLNITFQPGFGGNRIFYVAAQDFVAHNTDWQAMGVWQVPGASPGTIAVSSASPSRGSSTAGTSQTLAVTLADNKGSGDLGIVNVLINSAIDGRHACYLAYSVAANTLYLVDDLGDAGGPFAGGMLLNGGNTSIQNSQCTINGTGSSVTTAANQITLAFNLTFTPAFTGNRILYIAGRDKSDGNNTGWQALGTLTVQ